MCLMTKDNDSVSFERKTVEITTYNHIKLGVNIHNFACKKIIKTVMISVHKNTVCISLIIFK